MANPSASSLPNFRAIVDLVGEGIMQIDREGKIVFANPKICSLLGYSLDELLGRPIMDFVPVEIQPRVREEMAKRAKGEVGHYDIQYRRKDGAQVWAINSVIPIYDAEGEFAGALGVQTDFTERRQAEAALKDTHELFQATFEQSAVGMVHTAPDGRWLRVNSRFAQMLAYDSPMQLVGRHFSEFLLPEDRESALAGFNEMVSGRSKSYSREMRFVRRDGSLMWVQLTSTAVPDSRGIPKFLVTITQDISAKKAAEDKLLDHRNKLFASSKMSALGEMASNIAHEVNNPLSIIRAYAAVIRDKVAQHKVEPSELLAAVEKIDSTATRISRIVHSLVGYARDSERESIRETSVQKILGDTLELCEGRFRQNQIELEFPASPSSLTVECRIVPMTQVMLNLLNNAVDAVESASRKWVRVTVTDLGADIEIAVEDSGAGVPSELQDKIMQPFFSTKTERQGTGLGLSISKKVIEGLRGSLTLDSQAAHTRFVVRLPKRQTN